MKNSKIIYTSPDRGPDEARRRYETEYLGSWTTRSVLADLIKAVEEKWDTPKTGRRRAFFRAHFAGHVYDINTNAEGEPYPIGSKDRPQAMDLLEVVFVQERFGQDRQQLSQTFDWPMLMKLKAPVDRFVNDRMHDAWQTRSRAARGPRV